MADRFIEDVDGKLVRKPGVNTVPARDSCAVAAEPLQTVLGDFVDAWTKQRPNDGGRFAGGKRTEIRNLRAVEWLATESGVPERTIKSIVRGGGTTASVELRVADALMRAVGHPELLRDGSLTIFPNPRAPRLHRARCCGSVDFGRFERF